MNRIPHAVLQGGTASYDDLQAVALLAQNEANRLQLVRTRAEKWLGGLTSLTGLITTVLVIKGPQSTTDIATPYNIWAGAMIAAALALLVYGTYRAYQSAYGNPGSLNEVTPEPLEGLAGRLDEARRKAAMEIQRHLSRAAIATLAAVALLAAAIGITWCAPAPPKPASNSECLLVHGKTVAKLASDSATLKAVSPGTELRPCS